MTRDNEIHQELVEAYRAKGNKLTVAEVEELQKGYSHKAFRINIDNLIETNEKGGKQSALDFRLDLLAPEAMLRLGKVLKEGVHYGVDNWRLIDTNSHLNHALGHIMEYLQGVDTGEDHLSHAFCRLMMAVAMEGEE